MARKLKLDDCERLGTNTRILSARIENREITLELKEDIFSAGLRVLKRKSIGYVPMTEPDFNLLERGIATALVKAPPAPFSSFALIENLPAGVANFDPAVKKLFNSPVKVQQLAQELVKRAFATGRIETIEGGISVEIEQRLIFTLHSPESAYAERTGFSAFAEVNSKDYDFIVGRNYPAIEQVIELGATVALNLPKSETSPEAENMQGKTVPVILHPVMVEEIIRRLVSEHFYAAAVQEGMSSFRLNDRVAAEQFTMWDDATAPYDGHTFPTDDEGTPSRKNLLIENGVLKMFLYDRASAVKDGVESTGNGRRRPVLVEEENESPVRCSINDIYIAPGPESLEQMIKNIERGLVVKMLLGFHTANRTTGDFANPLYFGGIIRNGEIAAQPEAGRWALKGNALNCLKTVQAISREIKPTGSGVLPWVKIELTVA
ncbi:MAG: TldD/PmbA family protein [bacterium]